MDGTLWPTGLDGDTFRGGKRRKTAKKQPFELWVSSFIDDPLRLLCARRHLTCCIILTDY
jgi:hypothetical protein